MKEILRSIDVMTSVVMITCSYRRPEGKKPQPTVYVHVCEEPFSLLGRILMGDKGCDRQRVGIFGSASEKGPWYI